MKVESALAWMSHFNQAIQSQKDYLSDLDTPIGDGDHGANMARGMAAVMENLTDKTFTSSGEIFKVVAMQLISKVGGASGPLYGSAFMGMAKAVEETEALNQVFQAGLDMIIKRGKASTNEKTMVDVWTGAIVALTQNNLTSQVIDDLVKATQPMQATKGRASYLGERSIGHIDPGAYSSGLLFKAYLEAEGHLCA